MDGLKKMFKDKRIMKKTAAAGLVMIMIIMSCACGSSENSQSSSGKAAGGASIAGEHAGGAPIAEEHAGGVLSGKASDVRKAVGRSRPAEKVKEKKKEKKDEKKTVASAKPETESVELKAQGNGTQSASNRTSAQSQVRQSDPAPGTVPADNQAKPADNQAKPAEQEKTADKEKTAGQTKPSGKTKPAGKITPSEIIKIPEPIEEDPSGPIAGSIIPFSTQILRDASRSYGSSSVTVIENVSQLNNCIAGSYVNPGSVSGYDDAFFASNKLLSIHVGATSGSTGFYILSVNRVSENEISISGGANGPGPDEAGTCDMAGWFIFIEVPADAVRPGDVITSNLLNHGYSYGEME